MKLVLFARQGRDMPTAGILTEGGVVPQEGFTGSTALVDLIDHFAEVRPEGPRVPLDAVQILAPVPRPGKILCSTARYGSTASERAPLLFTLKSAESVIGPGQTVYLPSAGPEWAFVPEAELGLVIKGPVKSLNASDWRQAVFGYTCVIDVMAQGDTQFGRDFWLAKSDTLGPLGPCIVTADEVGDPALLRVTSRVNSELAQSYSMAEADYSIGEQIELLTTIMTLKSGDVVACGTSRDGLKSLADGDEVRVEITGVGHLEVRVAVTSGVTA